MKLMNHESELEYLKLMDEYAVSASGFYVRIWDTKNSFRMVSVD